MTWEKGRIPAWGWGGEEDTHAFGHAEFEMLFLRGNTSEVVEYKAGAPGEVRRGQRVMAFDGIFGHGV